MAETPDTSPFYTAVNSRADTTRDAPPPVDLISALVQWEAAPIPDFDVPTPVDMSAEDSEGVTIDMEAVNLDPDVEVSEAPTQVSDEDLAFPIEEADLFAPEESPQGEAMDFDLSSLQDPLKNLERSLQPVSIDELRRQIDAGILGNSRTDPFGDRLRHTIRQLVRGL